VLALHLGRVPERGRTAWLRAGLRSAIHDGVLPPGSWLPGARSVGSALGLARGTVVEAVQQLVDEGYLRANPRSGVVVVRAPGPAGSVVPAPPVREHSPGVPDLGLFPRGQWARHLRGALAATPAAELGYPAPAGHPMLREALAGHLRRSRGAEVTGADVVVVAGVAQVGALLVACGLRRWAVEQPGSPGQGDQLRSLGATVTAMPVDGDGVVVPTPNGSLDAVAVTPAHQYPTGCVLAGSRRAELVVGAREGGYLVLEDDYDAELRYDREPVGVVQALAPDVVVLAGSVSKSLSPALRLGWMVPPRHLRASVIAAKAAADLGSPVLEQAALARMISSGAYDRHVRRVRTVYRARRDALLAALARRVPGVRVMGISAGLHVYLADLPGADRACAALRARGVAAQVVASGPLHAPGPGLVLSFAGIHPRDADDVALALRGALG